MQILGIEGVPEVRPGDDLARLLFDGAERCGFGIRAGDVVAVCQKVVSKAEGRIVRRDELKPARVVHAWALANDRDPWEVQAVMAEARKVVKTGRGVLITETHHGLVCANAGVDRSNAPSGAFTLLPRDPDRSAARLAEALGRLVGADPGVVITDTFGRPFREGAVGVALGVAGVPGLLDYRGQKDTAGRRLRTTVVAFADEVAAAAGLVAGKLRRIPAVVLRGLSPEIECPPGDGASLRRPEGEDLFR